MSLHKQTRIDDERLPDGWWIERLDRYDSINPEQLSVTKFEVYEPNGPTWPETGEPRESIRVEIFWAYEDTEASYRRTTDVSWPSTGDKRPVLARALAATLVIAAEAAEGEEGAAL